MLASNSLHAHAVIYLLAAELRGTADSGAHITLLERCILERDKDVSPEMPTYGSRLLSDASDCATVFQHGRWEGGDEEKSQMFVKNK